jgi:hypothetical protein
VIDGIAGRAATRCGPVSRFPSSQELAAHSHANFGIEGH